MSRFQGTHTGGVRFPDAVNAPPRKTTFFAAILAILIVLSVAACATEPPTIEERAQSIDQRLMCPVCPAETIDQSQADVAIQMRELVREKLSDGESEDQIFNFFVDRYDKGVLAEPPAEGFNILVWVIPPLAFLLGLALIWLGFRQLSRSPHHFTPTSSGDWQADSASYLREIDEEFEAFRRTASSGTAPGHNL